MYDDTAALVATVEGCLNGIRAIQTLIEDTPFDLSDAEAAVMPLSEAIEFALGTSKLVELEAYVQDAEDALTLLGGQGFAQASVVYWDVLRCDPSHERTTLPSMMTASMESVLAILSECRVENLPVSDAAA